MPAGLRTETRSGPAGPERPHRRHRPARGGQRLGDPRARRRTGGGPSWSGSVLGRVRFFASVFLGSAPASSPVPALRGLLSISAERPGRRRIFSNHVGPVVAVAGVMFTWGRCAGSAAFLVARRSLESMLVGRSLGSGLVAVASAVPDATYLGSVPVANFRSCATVFHVALLSSPCSTGAVWISRRPGVEDAVLRRSLRCRPSMRCSGV